MYIYILNFLQPKMRLVIKDLTNLKHTHARTGFEKKIGVRYLDDQNMICIRIIDRNLLGKIYNKKKEKKREGEEVKCHTTLFQTHRLAYRIITKRYLSVSFIKSRTKHR